MACLIGTALTAEVAAQSNPSPPDFSSDAVGWIAIGGDFLSVPGSPAPIGTDPAHPFVANNTGAQPTFRIGDISNPNLKAWAAERMKQDNEEVLAGKIAYTARSSCKPAGVPDFMMFVVNPVYFIQSPKMVLMIYEGDQQVRHVYLNVPHSRNPKPSWYGESVGHYEGDTLAIDTIGMNDKTFIDNYRTPHTEKLHITERWRMIDGGKMLEVTVRIEDPDTFNAPWSAIQHYRRVQQEMAEEVCAENNQHLFDYHIPVADKPDF